MNACIARIAILVGASVLIGACASTAGLSTQAEQQQRSAIVRRALACRHIGRCAVAAKRLVEIAERSAARPADRRGAGRQPDACASPRRARARRWRWPASRDRRSIRRSTPTPSSRANIRPRTARRRRRPEAAGRRCISSRRRCHWEIDFWGKNRAAYESALGAGARRRGRRLRRAARAVGRTSRRPMCSCSARTCSSTSREATLKRARADLRADPRSQRRRHRFAARAQAGRVRAAGDARADRAAGRESIELARNQLAALLGQGPDRGLAIARPARSAGASVALPSTLPAELLGRRPDLIGAALAHRSAAHGHRRRPRPSSIRT